MTKTRKKEGTRSEEQSHRTAILLMIATGFLCGGILGGVVVGKLSPDAYIAGFLETYTQKEPSVALWRELWVTCRWPVAVMLLSFLPLAGLTVPVLFFARGFLLAYGITALATGNGVRGMLWAGLIYGPACLLTIPVMFLLGTEFLLKKAEKEPKQLPLRLLWCIPALFFCMFLNQVVVPPVLHFFLQAFQAGA